MHLPLTPDTFDNFHNLPKKQDDRARMLRGEWPIETPQNGENSGLSGCTYCKHIEQKGGASDRVHQLELQRRGRGGGPQPFPVELETDPTAISVTPTILEVYFNNVCNMACLYCGPHFSSMWEEENRRFDMQKEDGILVNPMWTKDQEEYSALRDKLFAWLEKHGHNIWNFGMLGGEPFHQVEFEMMLDHYDRFPNPDLLFTMTTNLKLPYAKLVGYVERIKRMINEGKMGNFNISASMDCWGPEAEYVRWGLDLVKWEKNFDYLVEQDDWLIINMNFTITPLTIKTLPNLIEKLNQWDHRRLVKRVAKIIGSDDSQLVDDFIRTRDKTIDFGKHLSFSFMHVIEPTQMNPTWFGPGVFKEDFDKVLAILPNDTAYQQSAYQYMQGVANAIENTTRDPEKILMLETYLEEIDRRRGTNWRTVFPWLEQQFVQAIQESGGKRFKFIPIRPK
jgi:hypothetical protein